MSKKFKGFKIWDKQKKRLFSVDSDGRGMRDKDFYEYDYFLFMITPDGSVVVWNDYQDCFVTNPDEKFEAVFN